ncbi:MAG TPA: nodulation protein NfeD, partial [bacterium]|nr:nodulation protein NfeD [bacterium]
MRHLLAGVVVAVALALPAAAGGAADGAYVLRIRIDGVIAPSSARYLLRALRQAQDDGARALLVELNTPGGLMKSMEEMTQAMLGARLPVIVYVSPSGARAASAGVFVTYAANIAAMAPATRLGAAHPVAVGPDGQGAQPSTAMEKVTNDAVAGIRAIARRRGRNADWAEQAVRRSVSIDEEEAVRLNVVDLVAPSSEALLAAVDGRTVETAVGPVTLRTRGVPVRTVPMDVTERFLDLLSDPNVGLILMTIALYGIIFELSNPGAILPGVVGAIALVLALASFAILQVNVAGLALIALSVVFFIADIKVPGHGVLTAGGVLAFLFGALLLTERQAPFLQVSLRLAVFIALLTGAFFLFAVGAGLRAQRARARTGIESLTGLEGVAQTPLEPDGLVHVAGETWSATSDDATPIR